jgi:ABC-type multidrug transport system fused ATPase/permease subunit
VDTETYRLIQRTIRSNFKEQTVLCIAHRLETIVDMNRIAVMSDGRVAEFDTPTRLLDDPSSLFCGMASKYRTWGRSSWPGLRSWRAASGRWLMTLPFS